MRPVILPALPWPSIAGCLDISSRRPFGLPLKRWLTGIVFIYLLNYTTLLYLEARFIHLQDVSGCSGDIVSTSGASSLVGEQGFLQILLISGPDA